MSFSRRKGRGNGQGLTEYGLILIVVAIAVLVIVRLVGTQTSTALCGVSQSLDTLSICGDLLSEPQTSFEQGTAGWGAAGNVSITTTASVAEDGTHSLQLTPAGAGQLYVTTDYGNSPHMAVTAGQTYTLQGYFKAGTTSQISGLFIRWYQSDNATVINPDSSIISAYDNNFQWTHVVSSGAAPTGAAYAAAYIFQNPTDTGISYVDRVSLTPGSTSNLLSLGAAAPSSPLQWQDGGGTPTLALTNVQAWTGTQSLALICTNNIYSGTMFGNTINVVPVTPGQTISFGAEVKAASAARTFYVFVRWYDKNGAALGGSTDSISGALTDSTSAWTQNSSSAVVPGTAAFGRLYVEVLAQFGSSETHYEGGAFIEPGTTTTWQAGYTP